MNQQFGSFTASELYCPKCRRAQPVREKLLLVLPGGELYEYLCTGCASSLGERTVSGTRFGALPSPRPTEGMPKAGARLPPAASQRQPKRLLIKG